MYRKDEQEHALETLREVLDETRGMGRRSFLAALSKAAVGSALLTSFAAVLSDESAAAEAVATMGWGGAWKEALDVAYHIPFTKKTGIPVNYISPYNFAKVVAMHKTGQMEIDFLAGGGVDTLRFLAMDMAQPLDWSIIDKSALTPNQLAHGDYTIGSVTLSTIMVYNKKKWPGDDHPKTWADFWDVKKFPGPRSMQRQEHPLLEFALMADGVPADPAAMYPLDEDRAFRSLDRIKPHIQVWWGGGAQSQQLIEDEEIDILAMWNGRAAKSIIENGAHYEMVWNQGGYAGTVEAWLAMKGAPNVKGAMKFLDYAGRGEPQAAFARSLYYGPQNLNAYKYIDDALARQLPSYPDNVKVQLTLDFEYWLHNIDRIRTRFEEWLQA
jgi:putative spermidine/putrescine transport system substrate-binding protein